MKRIGVILCLAILIVMGTAGVVRGASFTIEKTSPEDGSTGMSVDNMGVKVFFSKDIYNKDNEAANIKLCTLKDDKGKVIPSKVVFSEKNKDVMLVLADTGSKQENKAKGKTKYTLIIEKGLKAADGSVMAEGKKVTFETLDPKSSMTVSMVMMGLMLVGMIFFTSREAKKQAQGDTPKKEEKVNPYKVARETGKSVEEVVEKDRKRKEKQAAAAAKKTRRKGEDEDDEEEVASDNMRVSRPRPISEAGSTYRHVRPKKKQAQPRAKSTNPKKQTGRQRNKGRKKK